MSRFDLWILGWVNIAQGLATVLSLGFIRPKWGLVVSKKIVRRMSGL